MAWGRQWRGNDADDCTAIIVNNHVAPDQWRDKPDFLSDKLLEAAQWGRLVEQEGARKPGKVEEPGAASG